MVGSKFNQNPPPPLATPITGRVLKFQVKYSLKFQVKLWWNLAKISMKFPVKFHSLLSKIEISVQKFGVFWQLKKTWFIYLSLGKNVRLLPYFYILKTPPNQPWKLCETLWNIVKLCETFSLKFQWNFIQFHFLWNFRTLGISLSL